MNTKKNQNTFSGGRETFDGWPNKIKIHVSKTEFKDDSNTDEPLAGPCPTPTAAHTVSTMC